MHEIKQRRTRDSVARQKEVEARQSSAFEVMRPETGETAQAREEPQKAATPPPQIEQTGDLERVAAYMSVEKLKRKADDITGTPPQTATSTTAEKNTLSLSGKKRTRVQPRVITRLTRCAGVGSSRFLFQWAW